MKKVTLDLNIILDFLNKRKYHAEAAKVIDLCARKRISGYVCAHEITTLSYFLLKERRDTQKVKQILFGLLDIFSTLPVTGDVLCDALNSPVKDFEDAVIEVSSLAESVDYIITRNIPDFKTSRIKALTPEEYLGLLQAQQEKDT